MKLVRWTLLSAAFLALCTVAIVRAQTDDIFGVPEANPKSDARPGAATPDDDLFGPAPASDPPNQKAPDRAAEENPFDAGGAAPAPTPRRNVPSQPGPAQADTDDMQNNLCKCEGEAYQAAVARIETVLSSRLRGSGLDFVDAPLGDVVNVLQDEYRIPIQLDTRALDEIGTGPDEPVTIMLHNVSLRSALRLMLKRLQLTYIIEDEVLLITTPEEAESRIKVCVYDVRDLIDTNPTAALKQLTEVITSTIGSRTWDKNGGTGSVRAYPPNLLVISQPQSVHEQIQSLLKRMRQMRHK